MNLLGKNIGVQLGGRLRGRLRVQLRNQLRDRLRWQLDDQLWSDQQWAMKNRIRERLVSTISRSNHVV